VSLDGPALLAIKVADDTFSAPGRLGGHTDSRVLSLSSGIIQVRSYPIPVASSRLADLLRLVALRGLWRLGDKATKSRLTLSFTGLWRGCHSLGCGAADTPLLLPPQ
jgi:hypothetical protein